MNKVILINFVPCSCNVVLLHLFSRDLEVHMLLMQIVYTTTTTRACTHTAVTLVLSGALHYI